MDAREDLTTEQAAALLGYTAQHTRLLIREGRLRAEKFGRDWVIPRESISRYQTTFFAQLPGASSAPPIWDVVNVASVPQRSPFRYPGGKTWLVPTVRKWLAQHAGRARELIEPFAGGAIVGLTAVFEGFVERATLCELDDNVAAVWETILNGDAEWLADRISTFHMSHDSVEEAFRLASNSRRDLAFAVLLRNRISRGGIMAPGAGIVKRGENGKGLASRWYPQTLRRRIMAIAALRRRIRFVNGDGMTLLSENVGRTDALFFLDPPYTVAGRRLYTHSEIDHRRLFDLAESLASDFIMTYDDAAEIRWLAYRHRFAVRGVAMKSTHHSRKIEIIISRDLAWLG